MATGSLLNVHRLRATAMELAETMLLEEEAREAEEREKYAGIEGRHIARTSDFEPTDDQRKLVKQLATAGLPAIHICLAIKWPHTNKPIGRETLKKHFSEELAAGTIEANAKVAAAVYKAALEGNVAAQMFWLRARAGWVSNESILMSAPEGATVVQTSGVLMIPAEKGEDDWEKTVSKAQYGLGLKAQKKIVRDDDVTDVDT